MEEMTFDICGKANQKRQEQHFRLGNDVDKILQNSLPGVPEVLDNYNEGARALLGH